MCPYIRQNLFIHIINLEGSMHNGRIYTISTLSAIIVIFLTINTSNYCYSQVKLFKLTSVEKINDGYDAANLFWQENGSDKNMYEIANGRTIILSFWGTWCGYCIRHLPELQKLYEYLPKEDYYFINAIGEYNTTKEETVRSVLESQGVTFDNVWYAFDEDANVQAHTYYDITEFIATVIISPEKKLLATIPDVVYNSFLDS